MMKVPRDFDIFWPVHGQEAVREHAGRLEVARAFEHGRPEQGVEATMSFADEWYSSASLSSRQYAEVDAGGRRGCGSWPCSRSAHPARRSTLPGASGISKPGSRRVAEMSQSARPASEPLGEFVGDLFCRALLRVQSLSMASKCGRREEIVQRLLLHRVARRRWSNAGSSAQWRVGGAADPAGIAVLVGARRTLPDEVVSQEQALFRRRARTGRVAIMAAGLQ